MKKQQDNSEYIRVTQVLAPFSDFSNIPAETLRAASERGTLVHELCELYALDSLIEPIPENCKGFFESFKNWFDDNVHTVINTEERLYSEEQSFEELLENGLHFSEDHYFKNMNLTGQYDLLCTLKHAPEKIVLVDYKTPAIASKTWPLQSAAYAMLLRETRGISVDRRIALMLKKDGSNAFALEFTDSNDERNFMKAYCLHIYFNS